jgi:hypothetical protein
VQLRSLEDARTVTSVWVSGVPACFTLAVTLLEIPLIAHVHTQVGFTDLCKGRTGERGASSPSGCTYTSILSLYGYNASLWATSEALLAMLNEPARWNRKQVGEGFVLESALGGVRKEGGRIVSADVVSESFNLAGNLTLFREQKEDVASDGWELEWLKYMEVCPLRLALAHTASACTIPCCVGMALEVGQGAIHPTTRVVDFDLTCLIACHSTT